MKHIKIINILFISIFAFGLSIDSFSQDNKIKLSQLKINNIQLGDSISKFILEYGKPDGITVFERLDDEWTEQPQKWYKYGREIYTKADGTKAFRYELIVKERLKESYSELFTAFTIYSNKYILSIDTLEFIFGNRISENQKEYLTKISKTFDKTIEVFRIPIEDTYDEFNSVITDLLIYTKDDIISGIYLDYYKE